MRRPNSDSNKPQLHSGATVVKNKILQLLRLPKYQPLDKIDLSKKLGLSSDQRAELRAVLRELEERGEIARIRKDRYVLPQEADLVTGRIDFTQGGSAFLISEIKGGADLFIAAENTGTAMHRDCVVARVMHEGVGQRLRPGRKREGRVIRILKRANETTVGTLQRSNNFFHIVPDDPRLGRDILVHPDWSKLPRPPQIGDKVVVKLSPWESRGVSPEGAVVEVLGPASEPEVAILSIIRKHGLATDFPAAVLEEVERVSETIDGQEIARRVDCRATMICTIDPDDAKDFDDAIHVERTSDGWQLQVHIADVSHYVRPRSALDREALHRGNSVYLVDRVLPMLPFKLSNGVCSLRPDEDRLTKAAFIEFNQSGRIKSARFADAVINSKARLTYKQAFAILQKPSDSPLAERLHVAWELASLLRKNRFAAGSLDLDFPEVKVRLDERGHAIAIEKIENDISHQLIEEFMLAANEAVAFELKSKLVPAMYRIHEDPDPEKLNEYREFAAGYGYKVGDLTQRREVQKLLAAIKGTPEEYAVKLAFLKSLKRATYATEPLGHYGLAKVNYTHFTSPIRRYADLVVHRALAWHLSQRDHKRERQPAFAAGDLASAAEHISLTERTAADAEKESVKLKKLEFFQNQLKAKKKQTFNATIVDVRSYGFLVELRDYLLTGLVHVSALEGDFYTFDPVRLRFIGRKSRKVYTIGDRLEVVVARVDVYKQQIDFTPAAGRV